MLLLALIGFTGSIAAGSVFGMAALFSPRYGLLTLCYELDVIDREF